MSTDFNTMIESCALCYRLGHEAEAATLLQQVIAGLTNMMESDPTAFTQEVKQAIAVSLSYQQIQDWIGLADQLQFVLIPEIEHQLVK